MSLHTLFAVLLSLTAAALFAVATNLHRSAASAIPLHEVGPVRLLLRLIRTPRWLLGSVAALTALGMHTIALSQGTVIVVQAVLSTGLVLALALETVRERRRPRTTEGIGWMLVVVGVVLVLVLGQPHGGRHIGIDAMVLTLLLAVLIAALGLLIGRTRLSRPAVAVIMGGAAGACFALDAVFLKGLAGSVHHLVSMPALLDLLGFLLASVLGNLVVQRAYQQAPLRHVLPAVTAADPVAAAVIGIMLLHEHLRPGMLAVGGLLAGLAAMVVGIVAATAGVPGDQRVEEPEPVGSGRAAANDSSWRRSA
jgi:drug/metabolite transporter (DMT)-like permease